MGNSLVKNNLTKLITKSNYGKTSDIKEIGNLDKPSVIRTSIV